MPDSVIEVDGLTKTYREGLFRRKVIKALQGVSFSIPQGEIFGLLGPNGAGKTTLIKVLLGIVRRTKGQATVFGLRAGTKKVRQRIGYLPEHNRIPGHLTGHSALEYYGGLSGLSAAVVKQRRDKLLELVGLEKWGGTNVRKYSKGMLQRLGLAQSMLHNPELIILDEPTDGVDPVGRREIRAVLKRLRDEGTTIFLNSHLLQEVELVCDRVAILAHGTVRKVADVKELTQQSPDRVFRMQGPLDEIQAAFSGCGLPDLTSIAVDDATNASSPDAETHAAANDGTYDIRISARDVTQLNQIIDALRQRCVSIVSISAGRTSLEEAFISIIDNVDSDEPPDR